MSHNVAPRIDAFLDRSMFCPSHPEMSGESHENVPELLLSQAAGSRGLIVFSFGFLRSAYSVFICKFRTISTFRLN